MRTLDQLLKELRVTNASDVTTGRNVGGISADLVVARKHAAERAANPSYYARSKHMGFLVTREEHELLVDAGATNKPQVP